MALLPRHFEMVFCSRPPISIQTEAEGLLCSDPLSCDPWKRHDWESFGLDFVESENPKHKTEQEARGAFRPSTSWKFPVWECHDLHLYWPISSQHCPHKKHPRTPKAKPQNPPLGASKPFTLQVISNWGIVSADLGEAKKRRAALGTPKALRSLPSKWVRISQKMQKRAPIVRWYSSSPVQGFKANWFSCTYGSKSSLHGTSS